MNVQKAQLAGIVREFEYAVSDGKKWLAIDKNMQQLFAYNMYFFDNGSQAKSFKEFHQSSVNNIVVLPLEPVFRFFAAEATDAFTKNTRNEIRFDPDSFDPLSANKSYDFRAEMESELDTYNWGQVTYEHLGSTQKNLPFQQLLEFNRLEFIIESLSAYAQTGQDAKLWVEELIQRHWSGNPMGSQIDDVLNGKHAIHFQLQDAPEIDWHSRIDPDANPLHNKDGDAFTDALFDHVHNEQLFNNKSNVMNMDNMKFLQKKITDTGFDESMFPELEKRIAAKEKEFQLPYATQVNNKPYTASLFVRRSDRSDMYFFNSYKATVERSNGEKLSQSFPINKGVSVTAKRAYNLLQGRAVKTVLANKEGEKYDAWMQLDFDQKDDKGNFKVNKYNDNYGYDLREAVAKFPVLELDGGDKEKALISSLERGNAQMANIDNNGEPMKVFLEANPARKSINVYDEHFTMMKHSELPQVDKSQTVSQGQAVKQNVGAESETNGSQKQRPVQKTGQNTNGRIQKNRERNKQQAKIS